MNPSRDWSRAWPMLVLLAAQLSHSGLLGETAATRRVRVPDLLQGENPLYELTPRAIPEPGEAFRDAKFRLSNSMRVTRQPGLRHEMARFEPVQPRSVYDRPGLGHPAGESQILPHAVPYPTTHQPIWSRLLDLEEPRRGSART